ncbi:reverse transcriptase domain-containing protein [Tanacetum coccineum]
MTPLIEYLAEGTLPAKIKKALTIKTKARQYALTNSVLYKNSFLEPWLRCVGLVQAEYVVKEIHEGSCSKHSGPRSVVTKAIRSGYYWPTMHQDARNIIRKCDKYQTHRPVPKNPQQKLMTYSIFWTASPDQTIRNKLRPSTLEGQRASQGQPLRKHQAVSVRSMIHSQRHITSRQRVTRPNTTTPSVSISADQAQTPANSVVRSIAGKESKQAVDGDSGYLPEDKLREIYKKHYNQILPIMTEKVHKEKL